MVRIWGFEARALCLRVFRQVLSRFCMGVKDWGIEDLCGLLGLQQGSVA